MTQNTTEPPLTTLKPFVSPRELHNLWQGALGLEAIYTELRSGHIRSVRIGKRFLIPRSEIEDYPIRIAKGERK
jgi:excisionase family DNA binding protein